MRSDRDDPSSAPFGFLLHAVVYAGNFFISFGCQISQSLAMRDSAGLDLSGKTVLQVIPELAAGGAERT
ncbi:MAG: hypothetical protein AAGA72_17630, partial [Pseudomonadota bacterium]